MPTNGQYSEAARYAKRFLPLRAPKFPSHPPCEPGPRRMAPPPLRRRKPPLETSPAQLENLRGCDKITGASGAVSYRVPVAQLDRASASGAEGCRFEPCRGYFLGQRQRAKNARRFPLAAGNQVRDPPQYCSPCFGFSLLVGHQMANLRAKKALCTGSGAAILEALSPY